MPRPGATLEQDANDKQVFVFNWDRWLSASAGIASQITTISHDDESPVLLLKDNESTIASARKVQVRLYAGTLGETYKITNQIVTNETPAQTKEESFYLEIINE